LKGTAGHVVCPHIAVLLTRREIRGAVGTVARAIAFAWGSPRREAYFMDEMHGQRWVRFKG